MKMTNYSDRKGLYRQTLIAAGLTVGLGLSGAVLAASDATDATPHSDSIGAAITDTAITAKVKSAFIGDERLKNSDISVKTTNGVVTLTGTAASSESRSAAAALARNVDGVKSVDVDLNTPAVAGSASAETQKVATATKKAVTDSWITTKVKSAILADSVSKGFDVSVTTKHGVVMLDGHLANSDAIDHVKDIASKIEGVKSVNTAGLKVKSIG
jgi:hyperosmotically inducible periplasmic protein